LSIKSPNDINDKIRVDRAARKSMPKKSESKHAINKHAWYQEPVKLNKNNGLINIDGPPEDFIKPIQHWQ
jgi:hypothetical protein